MAQSELVCVADFEPYLKQGLSAVEYGYYTDGADGEQTLRDNVKAFLRYGFYFLITVSEILPVTRPFLQHWGRPWANFIELL